MNKKITMKITAALVAVGMIAAGTIAFADSVNNQGFWSNMRGDTTRSSGYGMMGYSADNRSNSGYGYMGGMMGGYSRGGNFGNGYGHMGGMMGSYGWGSNQEFDASDLKPLEDLKENVMEYLEYFNGEFEIEDIFVYSDSDYYFSIVEEDTGLGAMELLVNPVTGYVYPEFGPNMMWNTEYGMHGSYGYGMMGMMGGFFNNYDNEDAMPVEEALDVANTYLSEFEDDLVAEEGGHAFYGYYTFHVNKGDDPRGMMSVNAYTGDVWYHDWHGNLIEIISVGH